MERESKEERDNTNDQTDAATQEIQHERLGEFPELQEIGGVLIGDALPRRHERPKEERDREDLVQRLRVASVRSENRNGLEHEVPGQEIRDHDLPEECRMPEEFEEGHGEVQEIYEL